jgi:hypothetical protein
MRVLQKNARCLVADSLEQTQLAVCAGIEHLLRLPEETSGCLVADSLGQTLAVTAELRHLLLWRQETAKFERALVEVRLQSTRHPLLQQL